MPRIAVLTGEHGGEVIDAVGEALRNKLPENVYHYIANPAAAKLGVAHLGLIDFKDFSTLALRKIGVPKGVTRGANMARSWPGSLDSEVYEERCAAACLKWLDEINADYIFNMHGAPTPGNDALYAFGRSNWQSMGFTEGLAKQQTYLETIICGSLLGLDRLIYVDDWLKNILALRREALGVEISPDSELLEPNEIRRSLDWIANDWEERYDILPAHLEIYNHKQTVKPEDLGPLKLSAEYPGFTAITINGEPHNAVTFSNKYLPFAVGELVTPHNILGPA